MENDLSICVTCLSNDRRLISLHNIKQLLAEINFTELKVSDGGICWECKSLIMKYHRFKTKALQSQEAFSHHGKKVANIKPLTALGLKTNILYDYQYYYHYDPLTNCDNVPKTEENNIKEEYDNNTEDNMSELDEKVTEVYVETINSKKIRRSLKKTKIDKEEIEEKFIKVVFSQEEMVKNREEKRNHYNFKKIPYKCDFCVLGFTRKETYDIHMKKKHDESIGPYKCNVCHIRFTSQSAASIHKKRHYMCYRCRLCRYDTTELWSALNHCKVKHRRDQLDRIHCGQCDAVFKNPRELEDHVQTHHTLFCNECGVRFKGKHTLRRHKARIHAIKREFICDICTKTFMNKTRLESHMVSHNAVLAKKLAYCQICNVQYKNIYVYRNHLKNSANHSERTYSCPECNKKFASKVYWTKHYNFYHLHKSQYNCEICNKLFISEWRLKNHRQKHHGLSRPRDHPCNICGKTFFTISILRNHELTHSEQRSYMCEDCGDTFKQRPALYTHAKLVHGDGRRK